MKVIEKEVGRDFTILNLTDPQLSNTEWEEGNSKRNILEYTVNELIYRVHPDLITISGDLSWAGHDKAYDMLAAFLDSFGIPWAPVFGNHDNQKGEELVDNVSDRFLTHKNCVFEKGERELGIGNYVISIEENGTPVEALFMMDSHDRMPYTDAEGNESLKWAKLLPIQAQWIEERAEELKKMGCNDASLIMHIPNYAYRLASKAAYKSDFDKKSLLPWEASGADCWNEGYQDSIGVEYEGISSYSADDGIHETVKRTGIIKRIMVGHDHVNNWIITYDGIDLIYALKTGAGCYWNPVLNGGTVLKVNENGVYNVYHEYVDIKHLI